jgi:hypothetical protein
MEGGEVHTGFWWGKLRERGHLEDLGIHGMTILKLIFKKWDEEAWTTLVWRRIATSGGLLSVR